MRIASHFNGAAILIDAGEQCRGDDEDRSIKSVRSGVTRGSALSWRLLPPGAAGFGPGAQHHDISRCNPDFDELNDIVDDILRNDRIVGRHTRRKSEGCVRAFLTTKAEGWPWGFPLREPLGAHNGQISAANAPGAGAAFRVRSTIAPRN